MMQLFTEEGWSIVINKKRVGLLVLVEGNGPTLINEIIDKVLFLNNLWIMKKNAPLAISHTR